MNRFDWKTEISRLAYWKQIAAERDVHNILPWKLPRLAATENRIQDAEIAAGTTFTPDFKSFLRHADGWPGFHIATDLFGADEFLSGRNREVLERQEVADFIHEIGLELKDVTPIGASNVDLEVFLMVSPRSTKMPGQVIWFVSEEIDRFESFENFFSSMVNYNARIADKLDNKT